MADLAGYDSFNFGKYALKSEMDKAMHTLEGIITGITIDGRINAEEIDEIQNWYQINKYLINKHPFQEITELINNALADGILSSDEKADILWVCNKYTIKNIYYDIMTSDIQRLHGILHGILADNCINVEEITKLNDWLVNNSELSGTYPYEELCSLVTIVLKDGIITDHEANILKLFFSEFVDTRMSYNLNDYELQDLKKSITISGICAMCPEIVISDRLFCFTGASSKTTRVNIKEIIETSGGRFNNKVVKDTHYLIVGNEGNPCWAFSCYGRKVEQAVNIRKNGGTIMIIHENDFWDELR